MSHRFLLLPCLFAAMLFAPGSGMLNPGSGMLNPGSGVATAADPNAKPPNIVLVFMDDMGYADINAFGENDYTTKHLNRLAKEGRVFRDFVVSSAVCSASRAALLTGCYHRRVGIQGALGPKSKIGLHPDETTIAEVCKSRGYATACFGKWHLGHEPKFLPHRQGFDTYFGIPYSNDMWPLHPASVARRKKDPTAEIAWPALPLIESDASGYRIVNPDMQPADQKQLTGQLTTRACDFIRQHRDTPFFVYLPHPMVHVPLYCGEPFEGKSGVGLFGDVMLEVDDSIGRLLAAIDEIDAVENTLVIFTSDNGPWLSYGEHAGSAMPLREGKGTMWEGGYREPTIMRLPGRIPAGTETETLASTIDLLPTVAKLIGADLPDQKIDGKDISGLMFGTSQESPHEAFYGYYAGELQIVRDDCWKLVLPHRYRTLAGRQPGRGGRPSGYSQAQTDWALYDLDNDVGEAKNVWDQHPEVVKRLRAAADAAIVELGNRGEPNPNGRNAVGTNTKGTGVRPPGRLRADDERLPLKWQ
ncbi:MAG: sulfatase [Planctomycetota bacterium]